jgi:diadenosine tetraphosphatase ApaH/serine/threonine PP2A family protein phosphatase
MGSAGRHIFIGDVHGCLDEFEALLRTLQPGADDRVVLVGDLVAKGPDSQGVVALARERGALCVRGNHDEAVLRYRRAQRDGSPAKLKKGHLAAAQSLKEADWVYLEALPLFLRFDGLNVLVVHAGLLPGVPVERQSPEDLMTMRAIRPDGSPSSKLQEGERWAHAWPGPQRVVFGHDAISGLQREPFATGLDTGCVYGGELTALVLPEDRLVSVRAKHAYQELR